MKVYKAIAAVQAELSKSGIGKDSENKFDGYKFRGIDAVYNALAPLLAKHGLCILPRMVSRSCEERQSQKGGALFYVTVEAEFDFVSAEDGSKHTVRTFGEAMDRGDKATNKAMSAAYKYAAFQAFAIPTEGDNDADATSHEVDARPDPMSLFTPQKAKLIRATAQAAIQAFNEGNEFGAYEEVTSCVDKVGGGDVDLANNARMALWSIFGPHPALRSALKRLSEQERSHEKAA
jgi:hypothetical protein